MSTYRGRFAPSPTGPLHFGSLISALGSYLQARSQGGSWLVRIEDLDRPRCSQAAADAILHALESYGFQWDEEICWQSQRTHSYTEQLERLSHLAQVYPCACSRQQIAAQAARLQLPPGVYPGTCRSGLQAPRDTPALRLQVPDTLVSFTDLVQGWQAQNLAHEVGDFILRRADGLFAYQLAVVVDDAEQGITEIVRGSDLLDSTQRQLYLQGLLGYTTPRYAHLPLALNAQGDKLSKQNLAPPLDIQHPQPALWKALAFLGQQPPAALQQENLATLWTWALQHWRLEQVPKAIGIRL